MFTAALTVIQGAVLELTGLDSRIEMGGAALSVACGHKVGPAQVRSVVLSAANNLVVGVGLMFVPSCSGVPLAIPCVELSTIAPRPPGFKCSFNGTASGITYESQLVHAKFSEIRASMGELLVVEPIIECPPIPFAELVRISPQVSGDSVATIQVRILFEHGGSRELPFDVGAVDTVQITIPPAPPQVPPPLQPPPPTLPPPQVPEIPFQLGPMGTSAAETDKCPDGCTRITVVSEGTYVAATEKCQEAATYLGLTTDQFNKPARQVSDWGTGCGWNFGQGNSAGEPTTAYCLLTPYYLLLGVPVV